MRLSAAWLVAAARLTAAQTPYVGPLELGAAHVQLAMSLDEDDEDAGCTFILSSAAPHLAVGVVGELNATSDAAAAPLLALGLVPTWRAQPFRFVAPGRGAASEDRSAAHAVHSCAPMSGHALVAFSRPGWAGKFIDCGLGVGLR